MYLFFFLSCIPRALLPGVCFCRFKTVAESKQEKGKTVEIKRTKRGMEIESGEQIFVSMKTELCPESQPGLSFSQTSF